MGENSETVLVEGPLLTTGGLLGTKEVLCRVVVTERHLTVETKARTETLRFAEVTGTKRAEFRMKPWGPTTVQLSVEKATSNQFGANTVLLRTVKSDRAQGVAVLDAIERLARDGQQVAAAPGSDPADLVRRLAALRDEGLLTDEEFQAKKRALLGLD